jgi:16S rRNA (cytosine967-C5)-methyltransferase
MWDTEGWQFRTFHATHRRMTPAARLSATIEILADLDARPRPVNEALKDWALSHRFAGSGDRAGIGALVHDALRRRASSRWVMQSDTARATALGMLSMARKHSVEEIAALCDGSRFAPEALSDDESARLTAPAIDSAPMHVRGDFPEWLQTEFEAAFGDDAAAEGAALAQRAPLDLRVNTLKTIRAKALPALTEYEARAGQFSPDAIRVPPRADGRIKPVQADPLFLKGMIEIQDEGSQIVARLACAEAGMMVLDLCAGGGGKSLALASAMNNRGQVFATDVDARRLAPIHERLTRAGVRNVQVRTPRGKTMPLDDLVGRMDIVFVDAPCTGVGTWRRNPDAKWRMRPGSLDLRTREQLEVIDNAIQFVKPGGLLCYVTCSLLPAENDAQVDALLARSPVFQVEPLHMSSDMPGLQDAMRATRNGGLLTPLRTGTDGFYIARLRRKV